MKIVTATPIASNPTTDQWQVVGADDHATAVHDTTVFGTATIPDNAGATYYANAEDLSRVYNAYTYATQDMVGLRTNGATKGNPNDGTNASYAATGGDRFVYVNDISNFQHGQMVAILEGLQDGQAAYSPDATSTDAFYSEWIELGATGLVPATNPQHGPSASTISTTTYTIPYENSAGMSPQADHVSAVLLPNQDWVGVGRDINLKPQRNQTSPYYLGQEYLGDSNSYIVVSADSQSLANLKGIFTDATLAASTGTTVTWIAVGATSTQVKLSSVTGYAVGQNLTVSIAPSNTAHQNYPVGWNCGVITAVDATNNTLTTNYNTNYSYGPYQALPIPFYGINGTTKVGATVTGTTTGGSTVITAISSMTNVGRGAAITGTRIPANTTIVSVDSATQITISQAVTGTGAVAGVSLTVGASPAISNIGIYGSALTALDYRLAVGSQMESRGIAVFGTGLSSISSIAYNSYEGVVITTPDLATVTTTVYLHAGAVAKQLAGVSFTTGSTTVTVTSTTGVTAGMWVIGAGITPGTKVSSVTNSTTFVLSANPVANSVSGQALSATNAVYDFSTTYQNTHFAQTARLNGSPRLQLTTAPEGGFANGYTLRNATTGTISEDNAGQTNTANGYITCSANSTTTGTATLAIDYSIGSVQAFGATVASKQVRINTPNGNSIDGVLNSAPYYIADSYHSPNQGGYFVLPFRPTSVKTLPKTNITGSKSWDGGISGTTQIPYYANFTSGSSIMELPQIVGVTFGNIASGGEIYGDLLGNSSAGVYPTMRYHLTGTTTSGTKNVVLTGGYTTASLVVGQQITGTNIPGGTTITGITNSTTFTISANATATSAADLYPDFSSTTSAVIKKTATPTGDITKGLATISNLSSTAHFIIGADISGTGIPTGSKIVAVDADNLEVTISEVATVTTSGATITASYYTVALTDGGDETVPYLATSSVQNTQVWVETQGAVVSVLLSDTSQIEKSPSYTFSGTITRTYSSCTTTSGSALVSLGGTPADTSAIAAGSAVSGTGIVAGTLVKAILSPTQILLDTNATASGTVTLTIETNAITGVSASDVANLSVGDAVAWWGNFRYIDINISAVYISAITKVGSTYTVSFSDIDNNPLFWDRGYPQTFSLFGGSTSLGGTHTLTVYKPTLWYGDSRISVLDIDTTENSALFCFLDETGIHGTDYYTNGDSKSAVYPVESNWSQISAITTPTADGSSDGVLTLKGTIVGNHAANTVVAGYDEGDRYFGSTTVGDLEVVAPITVGSLFGTTLALDIAAGSNQPAIVNPLPYTNPNQYGFTATYGTAYEKGKQISGCAVTSGSAEITVPVASQFTEVTIGWTVTGNGIPSGTYVIAITDRVITLSNNATVSSPSTGATLTFTPVVWGVMIVGTGDTQEAILYANHPTSQADQLIAYTPVNGQAYTYNHFVGEPVTVANITTEGFAYQHAKGAPILGSADYNGTARTQLVATNYSGTDSITASATMDVSTPWQVAGLGDGSASISTTLALPVAVGDTSLTLNTNDLFPAAYPEVYQANAFCPPEIGRVAGYVASGVYTIPFVPVGDLPYSSDFYINVGGVFMECTGYRADNTGYYLSVPYATASAIADLTPIHLANYVAGESYNSVTVPHFYLNRSFAGTTVSGSDSITITKTTTTLSVGDLISGTGIPFNVKIGSFSSGTGGTGSVAKMVDNDTSQPAYATASGTVTVTVASDINYGDTVTTLYTTPLPYTIPSGSTITLNFGNVATTCTTSADATAGSGSISVTSFVSPYTFLATVGANGVLFSTDPDSTNFGAYGVYGLTANIPQNTTMLLSCNGNYQQVVNLNTVNTAAQYFAIEPFVAGYAFDDTDADFTFTADTDGTTNQYTLSNASGISALRVGQQIFASTTYLSTGSAFVRNISGTTITIDSAVSATGTGVTFSVYGTTFNQPYPLTLDSGDLVETVVPAEVPTVNSDGVTYSLPLSSSVVYPHTTGVTLAYYAQPVNPKNGDISYRPDLDSFQYFDGVEWHDAAIVSVGATFAVQGAVGGGDKTSFYLFDPTTGATTPPDIVINAPTGEA